VTWVYESDDAAARAKVRMRYHYLYPHQFDLLLGLSGFRLLALQGDYDRGPFSEESERLILVAEATS
jgi:hypothetical protein